MADSMGYNGGLTCALQVKDRKASAKWYQDVLSFIRHRGDVVRKFVHASPVMRGEP